MTMMESLYETEARIRMIDMTESLENNKGLFRKNLEIEARKNNWKLFLYQDGMSHLKAISIDDKKLIFGSSNFDFVSYYAEQEVVLVTEEEQIVKEFNDRIWSPDMKRSNLFVPKSDSIQIPVLAIAAFFVMVLSKMFKKR